MTAHTPALSVTILEAVGRVLADRIAAFRNSASASRIVFRSSGSSTRRPRVLAQMPAGRTTVPGNRATCVRKRWGGLVYAPGP